MPNILSNDLYLLMTLIIPWHEWSGFKKNSAVDKRCLKRVLQSESVTRKITDYSKNKLATLDHLGLLSRLNFTATSRVLIPVVHVLVSPPQAFCAAVYSSEKPSTPGGLRLHDSALEAQQHFLTLSCWDAVKVLSPGSALFLLRVKWRYDSEHFTFSSKTKGRACPPEARG